MASTPDDAFRALRTLSGYRLLQLRNAVDQQLKTAPIRTLAILAMLLLIWAALYFMLSLVFRQVQHWELIGVVADRHIFVHFFLVLAIMLMFSNAVLTFGALFGRGEPAHLLSMPIQSRQVVIVKWIEGMLLSSWSFLLLGIPMMLAIQSNRVVEWYYYPLFLAHFFAFVAIPACLGLLAAWAVAMWFPRRPQVVAMGFGGILLIVAAALAWSISREALASGEWLRQLLESLNIAREPFVFSTWTARGISAAIEQKVTTSLFYLGIVAANAAFLSWVTINVIGRWWAESFSRAAQGRYYPTIRHGWFTAALCWLLFFYLPRRLRMMMLKDLRGFARDATQWTQMLILFGLLVGYVLNLSWITGDLEHAGTKTLIAFLNLTTLSLILATFTSRFVFPLLSLESQQLWLLGLLPTGRVTLLIIKFLFALTITGLAGGGVMLLASRMLDLPPAWTRVHLAVSLAVCVGLCGLAVGLGARFPLIGQRNPARIASGFGGTFNLIASMVFVVAEMFGVALMSMRDMSSPQPMGDYLTPGNWMLVGSLLGAAILVAFVALSAGARHFERLEA